MISDNVDNLYRTSGRDFAITVLSISKKFKGLESVVQVRLFLLSTLLDIVGS